MKDILGREIRIGDIILEAQTNYAWLLAGVVCRFTFTNVFYHYSLDTQNENYIGERFCKPKYIIVISENDLLRMIEDEIHPNKRINFEDVLEIKSRLIK